MKNAQQLVAEAKSQIREVSVEQLATVKQVVFDKTGTLTTGNFTVKTFKLFQGQEGEAASILLSLEQKSSHPIAKSLVQAFKGAEIDYTSISIRKAIVLLAIPMMLEMIMEL